MVFGRRKREIQRLLVVEDEALIAFDNEHLLRDAGFRIVATVDRVRDALAQIDADADGIDLVLVDVTLSDGSGIDVARAARANGIAVLFVTGNCPAEAESVGDACLSKPYVPRDLLAAIDAIERRRSGRTVPRLPATLRLFVAAR